LNPFPDLRAAKFIEFARNANGIGKGLGFGVDSFSRRSSFGVSNRRLRRFFLNFNAVDNGDRCQGVAKVGSNARPDFKTL